MDDKNNKVDKPTDIDAEVETDTEAEKGLSKREVKENFEES